jgi:DNA-binding GntR family transcriptional regulator
MNRLNHLVWIAMENFISKRSANIEHRLPSLPTLREAVVEQLRVAIINGSLKPGAALKEAELTASLGLSATPVREALVQLAGEGLVEIKPNCVKRVAPICFDMIVELFEVQQQLWRLGYIWGAARIGLNELTDLERIYSEHAEAIAYGDLDAALAAGLAFDCVFINASKNRELLRVTLDRMGLVQRFVRLYAPELVSATVLKQHQQIISALKVGDTALIINIFEQASMESVAVARRVRDENLHQI